MKKSLLLIILLYLISINTYGQVNAHSRDEIDTLFSGLIHDNEIIRAQYLLKLDKFISRNGIKNKPYSSCKSTFESIILLNDTFSYTYNASHLLSKICKDNAIEKVSLFYTTNSKSSINELIAALSYLEINNINSFVKYFKSKKYKEINIVIIKIFSHTSIVQEIKNEYYKNIIINYVNWNNSKELATKDNPYRKDIVSQGYEIVPTIINMYKDVDVLPLPIIWILGEIGNPASFDILLNEYTKRPSPRTAISIGSSLGSLNINKLFNNKFEENELMLILEYIYGKDWSRVNKKSLDYIKTDIDINLLRLKEFCQKRSIPFNE